MYPSVTQDDMLSKVSPLLRWNIVVNLCCLEYCTIKVQCLIHFISFYILLFQDLTAIGISKPGHRKKLKAEIARLNIHDGIPDFKPVSSIAER